MEALVSAKAVGDAKAAGEREGGGQARRRQMRRPIWAGARGRRHDAPDPCRTRRAVVKVNFQLLGTVYSMIPKFKLFGEKCPNIQSFFVKIGTFNLTISNTSKHQLMLR